MDWAVSQVGVTERPPGSNVQPYTSMQTNGGAANWSWCNSYCDMCSYMGGYRFSPNSQWGERGYSYVPGSVIDAKITGTWRNKWYRANRGDDIVFDWNGDGSGDHIGKVWQDFGDYIITIEGNTGDAVRYRKRDRRYVLGFRALTQSSQMCTTPSHIDPQPVESPVISGGSDVKATDATGVFTRGVQRTILHADGGVFNYGGSPFYGSIIDSKLKLVMGTTHAVDIMPTPDFKGYWILSYDGSVFSYGNAGFIGTFQKQCRPLLKIAALSLVPWVASTGRPYYKAVREDGALMSVDPS